MAGGTVWTHVKFWGIRSPVPAVSISHKKVPKVLRTVDRGWRKQRGLPENPNSFGPLTNLPDYSFRDGRPTPLGVGQYQRVLRQQDFAEKVVKLTKEIDFAVERYDKLQQEEEERRQHILDSKLKPKGQKLIKSI
ncbi:large ribosomal subunit protein mL52 [Bacillus rossius redtenbacheri]|uniref:large ribosomal subunit protein mL52 n=1 Tax=Bacillus rossius redtenbacheri TaxID=93214 RepID=UPI002FDE599C